MLDATTAGGKRINLKLPWDHDLGGSSHFQRVGTRNRAFSRFRAEAWGGFCFPARPQLSGGRPPAGSLRRPASLRWFAGVLSSSATGQGACEQKCTVAQFWRRGDRGQGVGGAGSLAAGREPASRAPLRASSGRPQALLGLRTAVYSPRPRIGFAGCMSPRVQISHFLRTPVILGQGSP